MDTDQTNGIMESALLVVAYPVINHIDFELIQRYRRDHDELFYSVIEPHFTLVFPVFDFKQEIFMAEIEEKTKNITPIDFTLRCATINKDAFRDYYNIFLVPDEGYSRIVKLHDKLYSGLLKDNLRLDIDYIPHIGVGNTQDKLRCKQMVGEWNKKDFEIKGNISELTIIRYEGSQIADLNRITLMHAS